MTMATTTRIAADKEVEMGLTISMRRCSILALSPGTGDLVADSAGAKVAASGVDVMVGFHVVETKEEESFC